MLRLIRGGHARTRTDLADLTGLARSTVSQRVDALIAAELIYEDGEAPSRGGRPPAVLAFNRASGAVLVADLGATHCRLAVTDLSGEVLVEVADELDIADGPARVLPWLVQRFSHLLDDVDRQSEDVRGIGIGLPGPVEFSAGRAVHPPIMPGWDDVDVPPLLQEHFPVPVLVDNDVNIMALGEFWTHWRAHVDDLLFVKVGTGIGCGVVAGGHIHRGAQGAAGDLGHVRAGLDNDELCRCGNRGCVEAAVGGAALARSLTARGIQAATGRDVVALVRGGNPEAVQLVREGGKLLGEVLAGAVNFFNPAVIVIGGDLAEADEQLLAGIRELVYERSTALSTRHLRIERSRLGDRAGVTGAAVMVLERILAPAAVDATLEARAVALDSAHAAIAGRPTGAS